LKSYDSVNINQHHHRRNVEEGTFDVEVRQTTNERRFNDDLDFNFTPAIVKHVCVQISLISSESLSGDLDKIKTATSPSTHLE
jgi:hypothetical protein